MTEHSFELVDLTAAETHPLRRSVLRVGVPTTDVVFAEDRLPGVFHLGVRDGTTVVAVSTWIPNEFDGEPAVQLRGMATATDRQGTGVGGVLLEAGCTRVAEDGIAVVWARARDAALGFYQRHQFVVSGDGFIDLATQLPHHVVTRRLL